MAATDTSWTHHRARVASLSRDRAADDPDLIAARQDLKASRLADQVRAAVDSWPPLRPEQVDTIAAMLPTAAGRAVA